MELDRLSERVWIHPYEEERDRPNLIYIRGDRWNLAVDAGHSAAHLAEFYQALEAEHLGLPALTVLTHWHWDHTFAMHAVHGLCLANERTNAHLLDFRRKLSREGREAFLGLHESVRREYAGDRPVVIVPADLTFSGEMHLDPGGCPIRVFQAESPHTDDATLILLEEERILCTGDADSGPFPHWRKNPALARKLAETIRATGAACCITGHWTPLTTEEMIHDLLEDQPEGE